MQFDNQKTRNVADVVAKILAGESAQQEPKMLEEELKGNQHKIDANKNNKVDAHDFKLLRAQKEKEKANSQKFGKDVKEEVEEIDEAMFPGTKEYEKKYGQSPQQKLKKKGDTVPTSQGEMKKTEKGVMHTRRFSEMVSAYQEQGLKFVASLVKEEPTQDEYEAELEDHKAKAEGKKKQPEVSKGHTQAVKSEETEIAVIDADKMNGVQIDTIEEREMTDAEMKKREDIVKGMKKGMAGFKQRYGERAKNVMYAAATKQAMKD